MKYLLLLLACLSFNLFADANLIYKAKEKKIELEEEDKEILRIGEISTARYVTGGILGTYPLGFGLGHSIQGTWSHKGWIFTAGELGSIAVMMAGISSLSCDYNEGEGFDCSGGNGLIAAGALGFITFRIWEIVDVWAGVPRYEKRYRELKDMIKNKDKKEEKVKVTFAPIYNPQHGAGFGMQLSF